MGHLKMGYWDRGPLILGYWPFDIGVFGIPGPGPGPPLTSPNTQIHAH